jgi:hypothetical protein
MTISQSRASVTTKNQRRIFSNRILHYRYFRPFTATCFLINVQKILNNGGMGVCKRAHAEEENDPLASEKNGVYEFLILA